MSPAGLGESGGGMVNYLYDLIRLEEDHEACANHAEVPVGEPFRTLAKGLQSGALAPA